MLSARRSVSIGLAAGRLRTGVSQSTMTGPGQGGANGSPGCPVPRANDGPTAGLKHETEVHSGPRGDAVGDPWIQPACESAVGSRLDSTRWNVVRGPPMVPLAQPERMTSFARREPNSKAPTDRIRVRARSAVRSTRAAANAQVSPCAWVYPSLGGRAPPGHPRRGAPSLPSRTCPMRWTKA